MKLEQYILIILYGKSPFIIYQEEIKGKYVVGPVRKRETQSNIARHTKMINDLNLRLNLLNRTETSSPVSLFPYLITFYSISKKKKIFFLFLNQQKKYKKKRKKLNFNTTIHT